MSNFELIHQEKIPEQISAIFWDVDGTITDKDKLDEKITDFLISSAIEGIYHFFITGRDRFWILDYLIGPLKAKAGDNAKKVFEKMKFYPELGLMHLEGNSLDPIVYEDARFHPLVSTTLRERIATLFWQEKDLPIFEEGKRVPARCYTIKDANGVTRLYPLLDFDVRVRLPDFVWSESKELIGTAEALRDINQEIPPRRVDKIPLAGEIVEKMLAYLDIKVVKVSPISTAINITPIIDDVPLDKDWSAGRVLKDLKKEITPELGQVARRSVAFGDGIADLLFTEPYLDCDNRTEIAMAFVGPESQYTPTESQEKKIFARAVEGKRGPVVTLEILNYLQNQNKFKPF